MKSSLINLPSDIYFALLSDSWFCLKNMVRFDSALCNKKMRTMGDVLPYLNAHSSFQVHIDCGDIFATKIIFSWLQKRRISLTTLKICPTTNFISDEEIRTSPWFKMLTKFSFK